MITTMLRHQTDTQAETRNQLKLRWYKQKLKHRSLHEIMLVYSWDM